MKALGNQVANSPVPVDVNVVDQLTALLSKQLQSVWLAPSADEYRTTFTQALAGVPSIGTPDEPKRMPVDNVELDILKWIHPTRTLTSRLLGRLGTVPETLANVPGWFESRRLEPLMWEPNLPAPLWEALDRLDRRWLLPGLERVTPSDVATALVTNERFIEAFLLGANHELGREFLWRGFPTDQRGTALKCFWSRFDELSSGIRDFADGALGSHANGSGIGVVALFRGELIRRFGDTLLFFALKQTDISTTGRPRPVFDEDQQLDAEFVHTVGDNVALAGFKLEPDRALSENWWFVVAEHVAEPRFGLDAEREPGLTNVGPVERDDASWSDFDTEPGAFLKVADISKHLAANTAADVAYALFQQPVRAVYPAAELLGDGNA